MTLPDLTALDHFRVHLIAESHQRLTGRRLVDAADDMVAALWHAPPVIVAQNRFTTSAALPLAALIVNGVFAGMVGGLVQPVVSQLQVGAEGVGSTLIVIGADHAEA